jgi:hypothetical protein
MHVVILKLKPRVSSEYELRSARAKSLSIDRFRRGPLPEKPSQKEHIRGLPPERKMDSAKGITGGTKARYNECTDPGKERTNTHKLLKRETEGKDLAERHKQRVGGAMKRLRSKICSI